MRTKIVAGNWKMNLGYPEAVSLIEELKKAESTFPNGVEVMIAPPAAYLASFAQSGSRGFAIGAQDVSAHQNNGAFTGEVSAEMLHSCGITHAIVGHSERRAYHSENDQLIGEKIAACVSARITPVYCCGESLEQRESGDHFNVVKDQILLALANLNAADLSTLVIAYEPVWAIGTGKTASAEQAQEMHREIRETISSKFGNDFAQAIRILYGGSVKPDNAKSIFAKPDVDGGLIGGASLKAVDFCKIIMAAGE